MDPDFITLIGKENALLHRLVVRGIRVLTTVEGWLLATPDHQILDSGGKFIPKNVIGQMDPRLMAYGPTPKHTFRGGCELMFYPAEDFSLYAGPFPEAAPAKEARRIQLV